jgi:hypothetical protein
MGKDSKKDARLTNVHNMWARPLLLSLPPSLPTYLSFSFRPSVEYDTWNTGSSREGTWRSSTLMLPPVQPETAMLASLKEGRREGGREEGRGEFQHFDASACAARDGNVGTAMREGGREAGREG